MRKIYANVQNIYLNHECVTHFTPMSPATAFLLSAYCQPSPSWPLTILEGHIPPAEPDRILQLNPSIMAFHNRPAKADMEAVIVRIVCESEWQVGVQLNPTVTSGEL